MPLELGIWRIDSGRPDEVQIASMDKELRLEDMLAADISIASPNWMIIGRQVHAHGGFIDLLAIDRDGRLIVLELKRDKTPREVVAQLFDYASWVKELRDDDVSAIFETYQEKYLKNGAESLDAAFCTKFGVREMPETINESHELVVVASSLDDSTERIIDYLSETYGVSVNAVFFRLFKDENREYLTRAWLRDPTGVQVDPEARTAEKWNGEFYVSFGNDYDWEQARKLGYIAAGGGQWYSRTLQTLEKGGRIWVNSPGNGYVGVGIVRGEPATAREFEVVDADQVRKPLAELDTVDPELIANLDNAGNEDYVVPVEWVETVPLTQAVRETGLFGNQNSACRPRTGKWNHTVNRLKKRFGIND